MAIKVPWDSSLPFLQAQIDNVLEGATLRLYSNNHTPADADDVTDYTECTFPGYLAIVLTGWNAAALNVDNKAATDLAAQIFTGGAIITPEDIYGIYVTAPGGALLYAEEDPTGPTSMALPGQTYAYTPRFTDDSEV